MTVICRDHGLLFLENRNTGSTAISALLRERLGGEHLVTESVTDASGEVVVPWRHATLGQLLDAGLITPEERSRLLVVTGIRNPFDRAVTEYARMRSKHARAEGGDAALSPRDFERFVRRRYQPSLLHRLTGRRAKPQRDFARDADMVIRFERIQEDLDAVLERVGVRERLELPRRNVTEARAGQDWRAYYTPAARRIVAEACAEELRRYGYAFEPAA